MTYDPEKHHRHSIRLRDYDYSQAGGYFVTICTQDRKCVFGQIVDGEIYLNDLGQAVRWIWNAQPERFPDIKLDQYAIMPNHLHGIIILARTDYFAHQDSYIAKVPDRFKKQAGAINRAPTKVPAPQQAGAINRAPTKVPSPQQAGAINRAPTLGEIIRTFKALTTRYLHAAGVSDFAWQDNYFEHVIRNEDDLDRIRQYIIDNPTHWTENSSFTEEGFIL